MEEAMYNEIYIIFAAIIALVIWSNTRKVY